MAQENAALETTTAEVQAPAEQPTIGLADLQNAVKVIDYAAEQGAFKGWAVIEQVIAVRNKLNAFVIAAAPKEEPAAETTEVAAPAAEVTEVAATPAANEEDAPKAKKSAGKATKPIKAVAPTKPARVVKTVKKA